jgi:hypothetical protein
VEEEEEEEGGAGWKQILEAAQRDPVEVEEALMSVCAWTEGS